MLFRTLKILKYGSVIKRTCTSSTSTQISDQVLLKNVHRTNVDDPVKQSVNQEGQFYNLSKDLFDRLFSAGGFRDEQRTMFSVLGEYAFMVRTPFLDIQSYLERTDFKRPVNRYVVYGRYGSGKSFTLNHLIHYAYNNGFLIVHCPAPYNWVGIPEEYSTSEFKLGRFDTPINAALALQVFKFQNHHLLSELDLKISSEYTWSIRENNVAGDPLVSVIDHGINRIKHASDCYAVLLKELKKMASEGSCKIILVVDMVNALLMGKSRLQHGDKSFVEITSITIARALMKMFRNDWSGGAVIVAVDSTDFYRDKNGYLTGITGGPDLPKNLLGDYGFKIFDPFIPIEVGNYTDKEAETCLDYYQERHFLQRPESLTRFGREQIKFLSANNAFELYKLCRIL